MLLTIFGAGASYDSVDLSVVPNLLRQVDLGPLYRPPLANQLFDERLEFVDAMNRYPQMSALVPRLRRASQDGSGKPVEETLRAIQVEADIFPRRRGHLVALEFYLSDILDAPVAEWLRLAGRATNYAELLDQIERAKIGSPLLFVTFNYDRLLESAFADVLMTDIRTVAGHLSGDYAIIKPHGSVDWAQLIDPTPTPARRTDVETVIYYADQLDYSYGEIITKEDIGSRGKLWHPAVAIPLDQGKTFVCPPVHLQRLSHDLEWVDRILVVGWRATEKHFLDMLYDRLPKNRPLSLCVVDRGDGAEAALHNLEAILRDVITFRPLELHSGGFSEFVGQGKILEWLAQPLEKF